MPIKDIVALFERRRVRVAARMVAAISRAFDGAAIPRLAGFLARLDAGRDGRIVFDEYTQRGRSHRRPDRQRGPGENGVPSKRQFVAVTCHEDVGRLAATRLDLSPGRESIYLEAASATPSNWARHPSRRGIGVAAVRTASLSEPSLATQRRLLRSRPGEDRPVAFSAWLPFVGPGPKTRREHRTVTLPDYQGVGIGNALSDFVASLWAGLGYRAISTTTHPAMIRARLRSPNWQMRSQAELCREATKAACVMRLPGCTAWFSATFDRPSP